MKGGKKASGFTVVETLIVLAVTGGLFLAVAATLSGRQHRTQFEQAIHDIESKLQQVINEVSVGYYPNLNNFTCTAGAAGPVFSAVATQQGANGACIFVGKAIQFDVNATSNPELMNIYTIAGLRLNATTGEQVETYVAAKPMVVQQSTERKNLQYGLEVAGMDYAGSTPNAGVIAFVNSLATYSSGALVSGAGKVRLLPIKGGDLGQTEATTITAIQNYMKGVSGNPDADVDPGTGARICFVSGGSNQSGLMNIGSNNRQISVTLSIKENKTCS